MTKIFVITPWGSSGKKYHQRLAPQTPHCSGKWETIETCDNFDEADYYVAFWLGDPILRKKCRPKSVINIMNEPSALIPNPQKLGPETLLNRWVTENYNPLTWWVEKTYSELTAPFPEKSGLVSCVTTGRYLSYSRQYVLKMINFLNCRYPRLLKMFGLHSPPGNYRIPVGHRYRINFLKSFTKTFPGILDLYGKNMGDFDLSTIVDYKGITEKKWDALSPYRYSFAFECASEPNYFTEKLIDCILAGCMPLYWGCTNLSGFLPRNSFVELDITNSDSIYKAMDIINSDFRERNLSALLKAKDLILNKYQFWPTIHKVIQELDKKT